MAAFTYSDFVHYNLILVHFCNWGAPGRTCHHILPPCAHRITRNPRQSSYILLHYSAAIINYILLHCNTIHYTSLQYPTASGPVLTQCVKTAPIPHYNTAPAGMILGWRLIATLPRRKLQRIPIPSGLSRAIVGRYSATNRHSRHASPRLDPSDNL